MDDDLTGIGGSDAGAALRDGMAIGSVLVKLQRNALVAELPPALGKAYGAS